MRTVVYPIGMSLDGYIVGADGTFDWTGPDDELFRFFIDELREFEVYLLGRRLYEAMLYWEDADAEHDLDDAQREWALLWKRLPKVVFSTTLTEVRGSNTRLASAGLREEVAALRDAGEGAIAIGGATLAATAAAADLIDEYRPRVYPVLVGGGIPYAPRDERRRALELVSSRSFPTGVITLRYRAAR